MLSGLVPFPGCQDSCGIVATGPTSFLGRFLQYMPGFEVLVCSLDTDVNYVTAMLQLRPSLKH